MKFCLLVFLLLAPLAHAKELNFLFTHDLHSYLTQAKTIKNGGVARLATFINEEKTKHPNTLVLDAGDFTMGTMYHSLFRETGFELSMLGKLNYDAITFGNHEFDFRLDGLASAMNKAKTSKIKLPAIIQSNIEFSKNLIEDDNLEKAFSEFPVLPYKVFEIEGVKIGVFALLGKDASDDAPFAFPIRFKENTKTAKNIINILKNEKVDMIICLSHSGTSSNKKHSEDELLAKKVPEIDLIISGHTHRLLDYPIIVGTTVIASSGSFNEYAGKVTFDFENKKLKLLNYKLQKLNELPEDTKISKDIQNYAKDINTFLKDYKTSIDEILLLNSVEFEKLSDLYRGSGNKRLGQLITDSFKFAVQNLEGQNYTPIDVVIEPIGVVRDTLPKGAITTEDVFRTLSLGVGEDKKIGYELVSFFVTGKEIYDLLEVETTISKIKPDAHLQINGVTFKTAHFRLPFNKAFAAKINDEKIKKDKLYRIIMNYYTAKNISLIGKMSYGLLTMTPKNKNGEKITNLNDTIIQIKEWQALSMYLKSFRNDQISFIEKYHSAPNNIQVINKLTKESMFSNLNKITIMCFFLILIIISFLLVKLFY